MRACEGCRRRKIKCDAATTNTWPCSACVRLKLQCVRPNGFDGSETPTTTSATIPDAPASMAPSSNSNPSPVYDASGRAFSSASGHDTYSPQTMMHNAAKTAAPMYQQNHL